MPIGKCTPQRVYVQDKTAWTARRPCKIEAAGRGEVPVAPVEFCARCSLIDTLLQSVVTDHNPCHRSRFHSKTHCRALFWRTRRFTKLSFSSQCVSGGLLDYQASAKAVRAAGISVKAFGEATIALGSRPRILRIW